jgi:hypothetical protein
MSAYLPEFFTNSSDQEKQLYIVAGVCGLVAVGATAYYLSKGTPPLAEEQIKINPKIHREIYNRKKTP